jgi:PAS domain S-box-containing protein
VSDTEAADVSDVPSLARFEFLAGGGEMGALMREADWASLPIGPPEFWPQSLRTVIRILLSSRFQMWMAWGSDLTFFCNDAYRPTLGAKGSWALGQSARKVWAEIWPDIGPRIDSVLETGVATYDENLLLFLERNGFAEETYHTFSYSPLSSDDGAIVGMLCVVIEDTDRVIGERRLALLRDLASALAACHSQGEVCAALARVSALQMDLPFTLTFLFDAENGGQARLACATGFAGGAPAGLGMTDLAWPIGEIMAGRDSILINDITEHFSTVPTLAGASDKPPTRAVLVPLAHQGQERPAGFFVVALNPYRPLDADYAGFIKLLAGQVAAGFASAWAHEEERRRAEAMAEIDRAKTAFFSNVSHEFRTPLTLMLGPIEETLVNSAPLIPVERAQIEIVHRNGLRLLKLVNSLLDFSRIEAGRAQASYEPTDLPLLTAELASNFRSICEKVGLTLKVDCPPLAEPVYVDRDMWEKIVLNLLSNAFKFTFEGCIAVAIQQRADRIELSVRDSGTGIPAAELPRLFERFHRIEGARGRSFEGSGIGLALVHELVKLHSGTVGVSSVEGEGTNFIISIPLGTAHLPPDRTLERRAPASPAVRLHASVEEAIRWLSTGLAPEPVIELAAGGAVPGTGARARILLADDNADMRDYVARLLSVRHDVEAVADGQAALDAIRAQRPELVLTDMMMPRLDGFGLLRAIRGDPALQDLPVIVLSARAGEEASIEGLTAGADDYIVKPFAARELIARVDAALAMARLRQETAEKLRQSEERFRHMADNAPVIVWVTDADAACSYLSRSWYEFTGTTAPAGLASGWLDCVHPDDRSHAESAFTTANNARGLLDIEYRLRRFDQVYRWILSTAAPRFGPAGEFLGYIGSCIDITDRREVAEALQRMNEILEEKVAVAIAERATIEAQLRQAQKMEAVGKLTGGVAHDFNNLLQVIGGNLQLLSKDVRGNDRAEQRLQNALGGVHRGSKLAAQLLAFGRRQPLEPKVINLSRFIRGLDDMLRRALGEEIEIETVISGGLWNTLVDPTQVENALLNLAINARDAMGGHGKLTIEAGNASLNDDYVVQHPDVSAGQYVMLAVSDTGCGIPAELLGSVFEPFFTTKPEGRGTGLGLSMVYGFVKQSGGHAAIYSEPGHGTTVKLYLPRTRQAEDRETAISKNPVSGGTETILVVEDDEDVRATVVSLLADLGYRVLKAGDAQSALAIVESGLPIDLLFTDVVMPGPLRSPELARKAQERLPEIAVLFTSGYTDNAIVHGGRLDAGTNLLSKPYTSEALARKIRHVLADQQQKTLNAQEAAAQPTEAPDIANDSAKPPLRVLLVEDEELVRMTTVEMLLDLGYEVVEAGSSLEARRLINTEQIDILLTDVGLPGLSGTELAAEARRQWPSLPIIFLTGHRHVPGVEAHPELATATLLSKPYGAAALADALKKAHTG